MRPLMIPVLMGLLVLASGCGPRAPLEVTTIQLGRSLNSDNSVAALTTSFKPDETLYVAVLTAAPGSGSLTARWTYEGQRVSEETKEVSYRDQAATEFHIQTSGGFPAGNYAVEILLDGESVGRRVFRVAD